MLPFLKKGSIHVPRTVFDEMIEHAVESYPNECCGVLIGYLMGTKKVFSIQRATNTNTERSNDRYVIDPHELNLVDKVARAQGLEVVGFYHSHPDHPDRPSEFDREMGQVGYSYIIVSVNGGKDTSAKSWIIPDEKGPFKEEGLKVVNTQ